MTHTSWSNGLSVTGDGTGVVAHAGGVAVRLLADRMGLSGELSKALATRSFAAVHDRGRVLFDVAVMLADGGEAIADIDVLRHQSQVLGPVASALPRCRDYLAANYTHQCLWQSAQAGAESFSVEERSLGGS